MRECPQCWTELLGNISRCPACGYDCGKLGDEKKERASTEESRLQDDSLLDQFRRQFEERKLFLPKETIEQATEILSGAEKEIRRATVLMVDLRGYSRLAKEMAPEELATFAEGFYRICTDATLRRGGFVVEFIGDAVLGVFGAPVAFDGDTESAILAALDIREACIQDSEAVRPINVRIGIATGALQSGTIETPYGVAFHLTGDTVNLAARLQAAADTNEIFICQATSEIAQRAFAIEETAPLVLKNISDGYVACRVLSPKDDPIPLRSFETPFCGRAKELETLREFLLGKGKKSPRVMHLLGEAGLGKSRLVHEALQECDLQTSAILLGGTASSKSILLHPILLWLRRRLRLSSDLSIQDTREAIREYITNIDAQDEIHSLYIEYIFGVPQAISALYGMPPDRVQRNLFTTLRALFYHEARHGRLVLVADDLQWFDKLTIGFLEELIRITPPVNLALVLVYRPEATPPVDRDTGDALLRLKPLGEKERRELLETVIPLEEFLPEIREFVTSRASGNPLFLEEMTRLVRKLMAENARLDPEDIKNRIVEVIPISLYELIQSRIDRLGNRTRQVLQCAAVLGLDFTLNLVELFDIIKEGLQDHLHSLRAMQYLRALPEERQIHYYFTNGLFRDVAYGTLLDEQKRRLHGSIAKQLEEVFADRLNQYFDLLAFHYSRAGDDRRTVYYLVKAADRCAQLGESLAALEHYTEAIEAIRRLPADPGRIALMARLLVRSGRLNRTLGNHEEAEEMLASALTCADEIHNRHLALEARLEQAIGEVWKDGAGDFDKRIRGLIEEGRQLGNQRAVMMLQNTLGVMHWQRGDFNDALTAFHALAAVADKADIPHIKGDAFNNAGLIYWRWGEYSQALKAFKRALPLRRKVGDYYGLCATLMNIGIIQEQIGEIRAARRSYLNAWNLANRTGYTQAQAAIGSNLSNLERRVGLARTALEYALEAIEFSRQAQDFNLLAIAEENAGLAFVDLHEQDQARDHFNLARQIAREHGNRERDISASMYILEHCSSLRPSSLDEINELLEKIGEGNYNSLLARAYRLKGLLLENGEGDGGEASRQYLGLALEHGRNTRNIFDERDSLRCLVHWAERHRREEEGETWRAELNKLQGVLEMVSSSNGS